MLIGDEWHGIRVVEEASRHLELHDRLKTFVLQIIPVVADVLEHLIFHRRV